MLWRDACQAADRIAFKKGYLNRRINVTLLETGDRSPSGQ